MKRLLEKISDEPDCEVFPPNGMPSLPKGLFLPLDLEAFYKLCGGVTLFQSSDYVFSIVKPTRFRLANPEILPTDYHSEMIDDISNTWFIVAESGVEQRITIDLDQKRLGRCYDSFWDIHATPDSEILANSFTGLLNSLYSNRGDYLFWLKESFVKLGGAYDKGST